MGPRHNRQSAFEEAVGSIAASHDRGRRWQELAAEPSDPACLVDRAVTLRQALRLPVVDRVVELERRCAGRRVLDIGCVAHDAARAGRPSWLHSRITAVAKECVGVDVIAEGVRALQARGMNVICHDFSHGLGPFADHQPYDVIVAGELIEHLGSPEMLFATASELLSDDGVLILTSPNPWAPDRSRAGRRGVVYENVDHVLYCFPSGVAELAERAGLRLTDFMSTPPRRPFPAGPVRHAKRWIKASNWVNVGVTTRGPRRVVRVSQWRSFPGRNHRQLSGETLIYVVGRPG